MIDKKDMLEFIYSNPNIFNSTVHPEWIEIKLDKEYVIYRNVKVDKIYLQLGRMLFFYDDDWAAKLNIEQVLQIAPLELKRFLIFNLDLFR